MGEMNTFGQLVISFLISLAILYVVLYFEYGDY